MESDRIELEAKLAWLENYVRELDDVVRELASEVARLQGEVRELRERRPAGGAEDEDSPQYEKPPHY